MSRRPGSAGEVPADPGWYSATAGSAVCGSAARSCLEHVMAAVGQRPGRHDAEAVVHRLVASAVDAVPGADAGGVAELTGDRVRCRVVTLPVVKELHRLAVARAEGPIPEAVRARPGAAIVTDLDDTAVRRWPHWATRARSAGVGATLTVVLPGSTRRRTRMLTLCGPVPGTFDATGAVLAQAFAAPLAVALQAAHRVAALERGLASRDLIGQAKGALMARHGLDATAAFEQLVRISQETNTRLAEVAARLVDEVVSAPTTALDGRRR
jgi:hypothetical protein